MIDYNNTEGVFAILYILAMTHEEYLRYIRAKGLKRSETRYIGKLDDLFGIVGEVVIVNFGDYKLSSDARTYLLSLREQGRVDAIYRDTI